MDRKAFRIGWVSALFALVILTVVLVQVSNADIRKKQYEARVLLQSQASAIEQELGILLERAYALRAYIIGRQGRYDAVESVGNYILREPIVRNILVAPDSVVAKVLPTAGNEEALGLDLTSPANKSYQDVRRAIASKKAVLSGPYELTQGGQAISVRLPVFLGRAGEQEREREQKQEQKQEQEQEQKQKQERYWGLVSITIDYPEAIRAVATDFIVHSGYDFILMEKNAEAEEFRTILEDRRTTRNDFVAYDFAVENLQFRLYASPWNGWAERGRLAVHFALVLLAALALGVIAGVIARTRFRLIEKAGCDQLTGLYNREGGVREINRRLKEGTSNNAALILLDLDYFKDINDQMGHPKGDEVLAETALLLKDSVRSTDVVCRLGGDEFIVFLAFDGDDSFVRQKASQIKDRLHRTIIGESLTIDISASIGLSRATGREKSFEQLYKEADIALYHSKESGCNRITLYRNGVCEGGDL